jgi:hypothetical protein
VRKRIERASKREGGWEIVTCGWGMKRREMDASARAHIWMMPLDFPSLHARESIHILCMADDDEGV